MDLRYTPFASPVPRPWLLLFPSPLIGHCRNPFDEPSLQKAADRHEHQADGAIAAGTDAEPAYQAVANYTLIDRVAQRAVDFRRVVAVLATDQYIARGQRPRIFRIFQGAAVACLFGAAPPTLEVEKTTASMPAQSFSSSMRCIRTLPTIPRHPINPTLSTTSVPALSGKNECSAIEEAT